MDAPRNPRGSLGVCYTSVDGFVNGFCESSSNSSVLSEKSRSSVSLPLESDLGPIVDSPREKIGSKLDYGGNLCRNEFQFLKECMSLCPI